MGIALLGHTVAYGKNSLIATVSLFSIFATLVAFLYLRRKIVFRWSEFQKHVPLVLSGLWCMFATYIVICGMVGWSGFSYHEAKHPFYPALLCFFALAIAAALSTHATDDRQGKSRRFVMGASLLFLACLVLVRGELRLKDGVEPPEHIEYASHLSKVFSTVDKRSTVAYFWFDNLSFDTILYFSAQNGLQTPEKFRFVSPEGLLLDFAVTAPTRGHIPELLETVFKQVLEKADYLVINTKPGAYAQTNHRFFLLSDGQDIISNFLSSPQLVPVYSFTLWKGHRNEAPFQVLKNNRL